MQNKSKLDQIVQGLEMAKTKLEHLKQLLSTSLSPYREQWLLQLSL